MLLSFLILTPNWSQPTNSSKTSSAKPLDLGTLTTLKNVSLSLKKHFIKIVQKSVAFSFKDRGW